MALHPRPSRPLVRGLIASVVALFSAGGATALGVLPSSPRAPASEVQAAGSQVTTVPPVGGEAQAAVDADVEVEVQVTTPAHPSTTTTRPPAPTSRPPITTSIPPLPVLPVSEPDVILPGIYVMRPDGSGGTRVSDQPGLFSWSPDGRSIALVRGGTLVVAAADGSGERPLPAAGTGVYGPAWSSDGSRIAFGRDEGLWIIAADGSGSATLIERQAAYPSWTPDGRLTATRFNGQLVVWERDGTARVLATDDFGSVQAAWSADGSTVAYLSNRITTVSADGTGRRALTPPCCGSESVASPLAWSPDSRSLAYIDGGNAYTVAADGTPLARLDKATAPSWSPDGRRVAFVDNRAIRLDGQTTCDVGVASADGTGRRVVLTVPGPLWASAVSWNRTTDRLAVSISPRSVRPPAG